MLTLTENAASVIRTVTGRPELSPEAGLRIAVQPEGPAQLGLSVATGPEPGDQLVESDGARVYLESAVATALEHATLDAEVDHQGGVAFNIVEMEP